MKRMHIHVSVANVENALGFYSALFATRPSVIKDDYAKWMLDDPRVNFAISARGASAGLDHFGIQVESEGELQEVYSRLREAGQNVFEEGKTTCCYAQSEKSWVDDPAGISWEAFFTTWREYGLRNQCRKRPSCRSHQSVLRSSAMTNRPKICTALN